MTQNLTRTFQLDRAKSTGDRFPVVLTTEAPVRRDFGYEILDMRRLDLSRAPLPLIEGHDASRVNIGVVEGLHVDGDKLRGMIRLGKSARAAELAEDIREGIVTSVSVGYEASDPIEGGEIDGFPVYRFAACIHELSLVSCPADIRAGINRSLKGKITMEHLSQESKREQEELRRINTIESLAEKYELRDSGMRAIASGISVQEFNENSMKEIDARNERARSMRSRSESGGSAYNETRHTPNHYMGMPCDNTTYGRAMENYSLLRVLRGISDPRALSDAGLELEISNDMQRVLGKRSKGVMVPFEALQHRAVTASGTGSNLIATDHLAGSFIDVLRNRSLVMSLGPTVLRGLVGDVEIPRKTSGAGAYWIAGDDSDSITESNIALDQVTLAPKTVGGAVRFSHRMIIQSSPDVEAMVRQDLADMVASEIDLKSISGSGSSNQPLGILGQAGVGSTTYANGGAPDFDDIVDLETAIAIANADSRLAYLTTPTLAGALKKTPKQGSGVEGNFVWHNGKMNDLSAYKSNNMTDGFILLGDWSQLLIGFWGGIELDADPYGTNFLKGSVTVRVLADVDIGVRHPEAFAEIHEAAA